MLRQTSTALLLLPGFFISTHASPMMTRDVTKSNVEDAYATLQTWYNESTGIWNPSTGWWNSANCLTVLCNLAAVDSGVRSDIQGVITNTYAKAPQYNSKMVKVFGVDNDKYLVQTYYSNGWPAITDSILAKTGRVTAQANSGFLNDYYDDEGWWALAWIAAYDLTKNVAYLNTAIDIYNDMNAVFGKTNCSTNSGGTGGIWWDKPHSYVNAIANELFLAVAASLANRPTGNKAAYLSVAKKQWEWFKGTGMINSGNTIDDGLDQSTCKNNGETVWTYNQGVVLGGLVELSKATGDNSYIDTAHNIAAAAIAKLTINDILTEPCESGDCGADGSQFKGVFARNLGILNKASPKALYASFLNDNADSIWNRDRSTTENQLGLKWAGPVETATASTQSSAMDCLVASLSV